MIQYFRNFFQSKVGVIVTLVFLGLIALAFAGSDVANTGSFGGVSGGDRVAIVGGKKLSTADLSRTASVVLDRAKQQNPTETMQSFVAAGGLKNALDVLIDRSAVAEYAQKYGLRAGKRLVDSELVQRPEFKSATGQFDEATYRAVLSRMNISDDQNREEERNNLVGRQLLAPVTFAPVMPKSLILRYAALEKEARKGSIALLPSAAFAPEQAATDEQIKSYYAKNSDNYIRPERRVIRYATFGDEALGEIGTPSDADIAARYKRDSAEYAPSELRSFTQLVVPSDAAAKEIAAQVNAGASLEAAARGRGLVASKLERISQQDLARDSSTAIAKAAFAAANGATVTPGRSGLGYYVMEVNAVSTKQGISLAQVRGDIARTLREENRRKALSDLSAQIEDEMDNGGSLSEVAETLKLKLTATEPLLADGVVYTKPGQRAPAALAPALSTAFAMAEGEPQLAEVVPGKTFLVFEVVKITASAAAPLNEIRDEVAAAWKRAEGAKTGKAAADRVMARIAAGKTLMAAIQEEKKPIPRPDKIDINKQQLAAYQGRIPPVLALMFSMAKGTVKRLEAPSDNGWFIVQLDDISAGAIQPNDPLVARTAQNLAARVADEYARAFIDSLKNELAVELNQPAIDAVEAQLTGRN